MSILKKLALFWCIMVLFYLGAVAAQADLIVDTGQIGGGEYRGGYSLAQGQWLAGQFTLSQTYLITQVQGLIGYNIDLVAPGIGNAGDIKTVIYTNKNSLPGDKLQSQTFTSSNPGFDTWQGPSGLNWTLQAGTYWLAFEVDDSSTFAGAMRGNTGNVGEFNDNAVTPLTHYAVANASRLPAFVYREVFFTDHLGVRHYLDLGMRVYGEPSPVPLPGAVLLLGAGLARLAIYRRRKMKAKN